MIDGKAIGLKFGLPALRMLVEKAVEFPNIWNKHEIFNEAGWAYLLYFGYVNNCMVKEIVPELKFETFMDYVEEVAHDTELAQPLNAVIAIWAASREVVRLNKPAGEEKKSNGDLMKSNLSATAPSE